VYEQELQKAYKIAEDMVDKYKMETSSEQIIEALKTELKTEISNNKKKVKELKEKLLKDEVVF